MASRDTSDEKQVQKEQQTAELREHVERDMMQAVLKTYEGRHVLFTILAQSGIYHDFNVSDPELPKYIGRRAVGLELLVLAEQAFPGVYALMQKEGADFEAKYPMTEEEDNG